MTETKAPHTPGPWTAYYSETAAQWYIDAAFDGQFSLRPTSDAISRAEMEANARLIAAAPDLLTALNALIDLYNDPEYVEPQQWADAYQVAHAATAKAEGDPR